MQPANDGEWRLADTPAYRGIERALWTLAPILLLLMGLSVWATHSAHQRAAVDVAKQISAENQRYCEKWGVPVGGPQYGDCLRDLTAIRASTEQRARGDGAVDF